jgi:hypothetical protein
MSAQFADFCLQPLDLRLEPSNIVGESLNLSLLHVRLRLTMESEPAKSIFKEPEEGARSM